jgi:hypothetical protein
MRLPDGEAPVATAEDFLALNRSLQAMGGGAGSGIRGSMQALVHSSMIWSEVCGILGIAHRMSSRVEPQRGPILVSGQTLEAFSDAEIASLLSGFVILDAVAAEGLLRRGFGDQLGIRSATWQSQEETAYSYEQIDAADRAAYGVAHPRMCAQRCADKVWAMDCHADAKALSTLRFSAGVSLLKASIIFETLSAGSVLPCEGVASRLVVPLSISMMSRLTVLAELTFGCELTMMTLPELLVSHFAPVLAQAHLMTIGSHSSSVAKPASFMPLMSVTRESANVSST